MHNVDSPVSDAGNDHYEALDPFTPNVARSTDRVIQGRDMTELREIEAERQAAR
jgi:hypothetical protein